VSERTDADLFDGWVSGDRRAGAELFRRHFKSLVRFFTNKVTDETEVEDLVQRTLTACVEAQSRYRKDASFRTFLFAVARNTLLKYLRDHKQLDALESNASLADCGMGVITVLELDREQRLLLTALRHLSVDAQVVLELYYWEQLNANEIAEVLDISEPAVRGRLRKAKLELRGAIDSLARDPKELASTLDGLERWAASLRAKWA
jgi:RNA polymerase sigma-70 factor (ECF subfamily)